MKERETRNYKELEEFVLVRNDKTPIFKESNVKVRPIAIGKNGPVFEIVDKDDNRIGIVNDNHEFDFDNSYSKELKEKMGELMYKNLGFDDEKIKIDIQEQLKQQELNKKDRLEQQSKNQEIQNETEEKDDKENKEIDENKKNENIDKKIEEKEGVKVSKVTPLKNSIDVPGYTNQVFAAEKENGTPQKVLYGKNSMTGEIEEIKGRYEGRKTVQRIDRNGTERITDSGDSYQLYGGDEIGISNNGGNSLDVVKIEEDRGNDGVVDARELSTYNNPATYDAVEGNYITKTEAEELIENERNPIVRDKMMERLENTDNVTRQDLSDWHEEFDSEIEQEEEIMRKQRSKE